MFHQLKETIHVELNGELKRNILKAMTTLVFELPYRKNSLEYNQLILRVLFFFIHLFNQAGPGAPGCTHSNVIDVFVVYKLSSTHISSSIFLVLVQSQFREVFTNNLFSL